MLLVCSCAAAQDDACNANAESDDCQLLQSGVGVVSTHGEHDTKKGLPEIMKALSEHGADPKVTDAINKISDVVGGGDKLEADFDKIKTEIGFFYQEVHDSVSKLIADTSMDSEIEAKIGKVDECFKSIHAAALALAESVRTTTSDVEKVGIVLPESIKKYLTAVLQKARTSVDDFAKQFEPLNEWRSSEGDNATAVCATIQEAIQGRLTKLHGKVESLLLDLEALTTKGMPQEFLDAKAQLPDSIKIEVDKVLAKANDAGEFLEQLPKEIEELAAGLSTALQSKCPGHFHSASRHLQVGLLSSAVLIVLGLSM